MLLVYHHIWFHLLLSNQCCWICGGKSCRAQDHDRSRHDDGRDEENIPEAASPSPSACHEPWSTTTPQTAERIWGKSCKCCLNVDWKICLEAMASFRHTYSIRGPISWLCSPAHCGILWWPFRLQEKLCKWRMQSKLENTHSQSVKYSDVSSNPGHEMGHWTVGILKPWCFWFT